MKTAVGFESERPLTASAAAPSEARCSFCGGVVILRRRACMNGERTYYWRHRDNRNRTCNGRSRPASS